MTLLHHAGFSDSRLASFKKMPANPGIEKRAAVFGVASVRFGCKGLLGNLRPSISVDQHHRR